MIVTIRTNITPPFVFDTSGKSPAAGAGGELLKLIQPSINADLPAPIGPLHYAPAGEPSGFGMIVLSLIVGLALYGAYKLIR